MNQTLGLFHLVEGLVTGLYRYILSFRFRITVSQRALFILLSKVIFLTSRFSAAVEGLLGSFSALT